MTMPIRGRAGWCTLTLALALLLPAAANAQNAYITNSGNSTVSVIDTATNKVTATIPVGSGPYGVAVTPDGAKAYVANFGDNTVSVINTATNTVTATIPVGEAPEGVAVTPDGAKVYVTNGLAVSVIDTATNTVAATIPDGDDPAGVAVTPDGTTAYVTSFLNKVSVIDTATNKVSATIDTGAVALMRGVAVTPDGTKVYIANLKLSRSVLVIATATNTVVATIPVSWDPEGVAVTPDGAKVYVTHQEDGMVSVIATATNTVVATISVSEGPEGVAVTPDGAKAYVANYYGNTVSVIDTATDTVTTKIPAGRNPAAFGKFIGGPSHGSRPVAVNETAATTANTPVTIDLTAGASGNPTSAALVGTPAGGMVTGFPATTVTFTPTTGFAGAASFQFTLANGNGTSNTATATITVTGPPTAVDQTASTTPGTPVPIYLRAGARRNPASAALVGTPAGGTVTGFPAMTVTFTPAMGFTGTASFQFTLANAFGTSNTATATITVALHSPPVANDQAVSTTAGTPVTIKLSKRATGSLTLAALVPTVAKIFGGPAHGAITGIPTTNVTYTPAGCSVEPDSFQFTLANAGGKSNVATVTITMNAVSTPAIEVHLVDPFLLGADLSNIDLTPLYKARNWLDVQANGLVADNTSAAIAVVQTNDSTSDVTLTTTNGTTLVEYSKETTNLLTKAPTDTPGAQSLLIKAADLVKAGGSLFAAAWVQAPPKGTLVDWSHLKPSVEVAAKQGGGFPGRTSMFLAPPPVVLVHGIWGDKHSLGGQDGAGGIDGLAWYLKQRQPWVFYPDFVQVLCYTKYFGFNAPIDPLSKSSSDPCEYTSKDAIMSTIGGLNSTLDSAHIAGGRVDVVAHSMGGLAARYYASKPALYKYLRNRNQGQFHEIITLDTPELGSKLAPFLNKHGGCTFEAPIDPLIKLVCVPSLFPTVRKCFANRGFPLAYPGYDLNFGAVYSLYPPVGTDGDPDGTAIKNLPPDPKIKDADWYAISASAPKNSALEFLLNGIIAVVHPDRTPTCGPITAEKRHIDDILGDQSNDAIVTLPSQLGGLQPDNHTFPGLSHIRLPPFIASPLGLAGYSNDNVEDSLDVWQLVACRLSRPGDNTCAANLQANAIQAKASKAAPANKNAVPMPHIAVAHPHSVDRLTLRAPGTLELGTPFELAVNTGSGGLPELHVAQASETGTQKELPATISRVAGQTVYLSVTPKFFGTTRFQVSAAYRDGGVASKEFTTNVSLPSRPPVEFHADTFPVTGIRLDLDNPSLRLQPWAIYANIPERVYLDSRYVSYSIAPGMGPPVVSLDPNGVVHGLRKGTATILARFGLLTGQVRVDVAAEQR